MLLSPEERAEQEEIAELERAIMLGTAMMTALNTPDSALNTLLDRAREDAVEAGARFLDADLTSEKGVREAMAWQARYHRFRQLIAWIYEAGGDADAAVDTMSELVEMDDDEALRREMDGRQPNEYTDA